MALLVDVAAIVNTTIFVVALWHFRRNGATVTIRLSWKELKIIMVVFTVGGGTSGGHKWWWWWWCRPWW